MKLALSALLVALALIPTQAHASFFQVYCSNADGSIKTASGHQDNFIKLTQRTYDQTGSLDSIIDLSYDAVTLTELNTQNIEDTSWNTCQEGAASGIGYWRKIYVQNLKVSNIDGSLFDEHTLGVSEDRTTVEAAVICEENGNSLVLCN